MEWYVLCEEIQKRINKKYEYVGQSCDYDYA